MGANTIGVVGVPLDYPGASFPTVVAGNVPGIVGTNRITLPPGGDLLIPSGTWLVNPGQYSTIQILDPVTTTWLPYSVAPGQPETLNSDGVNFRLINPLGFPIGAVVTSSGAGFTSAPTVTATPGGSTWTAVLGPGVSALQCPSTATTASGAGYAVPPLISIAAPPIGGVPATAVCAISGGVITSFTITNPGAGYSAGVPAVVAVPQQSDFNNTSTSTTALTTATVRAVTSFVGQVCAVLLVNEGNNPLTAAPALAFTGGGGTTAAATAILAQTVTTCTVTTAGSGYPTSGLNIVGAGGSIATQSSGVGAATNSPAVSTGLIPMPRQAQLSATTSSQTGVQVGLVIDGGIYTAIPTLYAVPGPAGGVTTNAVFTPVMGSVSDTVYLTKL